MEQETDGVVVFRRTEQDFVRAVYRGMNAVIPLDELGKELPRAEIYHGVEFIPEGDDDESTAAPFPSESG